MNSFMSRYGETSAIRVLIANLTGVVAELIAQVIQQQPDIELLGIVTGWNEVNTLIDDATILVLTVEDKDFSSETCLWLLNDYPQLKIIMLRMGSDENMVYWRTLHCQQMQVISSQTLIASIRRIHLLPYADVRQPSSFSEIN